MNLPLTKILVGPPGCGKTTYAKSHQDAIICSADDWFMVDGEYRFDPTLLARAHSECLLKFCQSMMDERTVILDNTNIETWMWKPYATIAQAMGRQVEWHFWHVETIADLRTCTERNTHGVPTGIIAQMVLAMEIAYGQQCFHHGVTA